MKKYLLLVATAAVAFASCQKAKDIPVVNDQKEISFVNFMTKGYTTGTTFYETLVMNLHPENASKPESDAVSRNMHVSAYLYGQDGVNQNYFSDNIFKEKEAVWHNWDGLAGEEKPIYWPIGGKLDFLAVSFSTESEGTDPAPTIPTLTVEFDSDNCASSAAIKVEDGKANQNDILFASATSRKSNEGETSADVNKGCLPLTFDHAQAWIEFVVKANEDDIITIKNITLENIYTGGDLTIANNNGAAKAAWDFRTYTAKDAKMDTKAVAGESAQDGEDEGYGTLKLKKEKSTYFDMLIPEQAKTAFVIEYTLKNQDTTLKYRYELNHENWLMGKKYVYNVEMDVYEITIKPEVTGWVDGDMSDAESGNIKVE